MAGVDIDKRIKRGLARAKSRTGDGGGLVELREITSAPSGPLNPSTPVTTWHELKDCVFTSVDLSLFGDATLVKTGDIGFVANGDRVISQSDYIRRDGKEYIIIGTPVVNPSGTVLAYKGVARSL